MFIKSDDTLKRCEIWIPYEDRATYKTSSEYMEKLRQYKAKKYNICVFIGGQEPLLPTITALLDEQGKPPFPFIS